MKKCIAIILAALAVLTLVQTAAFAQETKEAGTAYKTGVYLVNGTYTYFENGSPSDKTGIARRVSDNKKVYVEKGVFKKATGLAHAVNSDRSYYVEKGVFKKYTGLARTVSGGKWVFVKKGKPETDPKKMVLTAKDKKAGRKETFLQVYAKALCVKITKPKMTKKQKLRACFDYVSNRSRYKYKLKRIPHYYGKDWPVVYGYDMIHDGSGVCFGYTALFGYLAGACGYKVYCCNGGGHGWVEINGKIYDPTFADAKKPILIFGRSYKKAKKLNPGAKYGSLSKQDKKWRKIKLPENNAE